MYSSDISVHPPVSPSTILMSRYFLPLSDMAKPREDSLVYSAQDLSEIGAGNLRRPTFADQSDSANHKKLAKRSTHKVPRTIPHHIETSCHIVRSCWILLSIRQNAH
jgi:hypothetical protein